jgi:hypothetical protein
MGHLTDVGFQMALDLGSQLRQRYIDQHKLLPHRLDLNLVHAESTAVQRTVATLRGVLSGLYPNASGVVPVAVRPYAQVRLKGFWREGLLCRQVPCLAACGAAWTVPRSVLCQWL